MVKIYYNPECSKCREGLCLIEESGNKAEVIEYLNGNLSEIELNEIIQKLGIEPVDLVRKNEPQWIENYADKPLTNEKIIEILLKKPILMQRPIVINGNKAIIGRPPVLIKDIL